LTASGVRYLRQTLLCTALGKPPAAAEDLYPLPSWDADGRRLWLGERLLKQFRQPAPNQTRLLDVFEEYGWVNPHIDDPLPPRNGETEDDGKRRLHETLKNLNRKLPAGTIRFRGDGTGQGINWEYDRQDVTAPRPRPGRGRVRSSANHR
jgi:hypothetical protein